MHVLLVANTAASMVWFRLPLLRTLVARGHDVWVAAPRGPGVKEIVATGASFLPLFEAQGWAPAAGDDTKRSYTNPLVDVHTARAVRRACRLVRPDVVLTYTHKMTVIGAAAARAAGVSHVHGMITGMGFAHLDGDVRQRARRLAFHGALRVAGRLTDSLILLNQDNLDDARRLHLAPRGRLFLLDGEGIDTARFQAQPPPATPGAPSFLTVARLVRHKGVATFVAAARKVKAAVPGAVFRVAGESDPRHPDAIPAAELDAWRREGVVDLLGFVSDMPALYRQHDVFVLTSGGTEGLPMSILEAMASGRPVITSRVAGNRETVGDGESGFLVDEGDVDGLADRMLRLARDPVQVVRMGEASRIRCEQRFDQEIVNARLLAHLGL